MDIKSKKAFGVVLITCLLQLLSACGGSSSSSQSNLLVDVNDLVDIDGNGSNSNRSLSGTIYVERDSDVDADVESDDINFVQLNNSIAQAQALSNPSTVGGFLSGYNGEYPNISFRNSVLFRLDGQDFYDVSVLEGQRINLAVFYADEMLTDINVELFLRPKSSPNTSVEYLRFTNQAVKSFVVPNTDDYYLEIRARTGNFNPSDPVLYSLSISQYLVESTSVAMPDRLQDIREGEVIVQFKENDGINAQSLTAQSIETTSRAERHGLTLGNKGVGKGGLYRMDEQAMQRGMVFEASAASEIQSGPLTKKLRTWQTIEALRQQTDVLFAEPNYIYRPSAGTTEPEYLQQWNLQMLDLPSAWELSTGSGVTVAVIDSGVVENHVDLQANLLMDDAYDFISDIDSAGDGTGMDDNPNDEGVSFHGNHVAGIIAANGRNGEGIAGVAYDANVMPLRVIGTNDEATTFDIASAILYAAGIDNASNRLPSAPADIVNLSLGGYGESSFLNSAIQSAIAQGVIIIAAAGNNNSSDLFYPAAYEGVVGVGSINSDQTRSSFSNYGSFVDVVAPGGTGFDDIRFDGFQDGILSTVYASEYAEYAGTSMAAPHIAGVAALMKSYNNAVDQSLFQIGLTSGELTEDLGDVLYDTQFGYGLINASKAMSWLGGGIEDQLNVHPATLGFIGSNTTMTLTVSNPGEGDLNITSITPDQSWITVQTSETTSNGYKYPVTVNLSQLNTEVSSGELEIIYSIAGGSQEVHTVQVFASNTTDTDDTVGELTVFLIDQENSGELFDSVLATENNDGSYRYTFSDVPGGNYFVLASTDHDYDLYLLDDGEARGAYPFFSRLEPVEVSSSNLSGLDFEVEFQTLVQTAQTSSQGVAVQREQVITVPIAKPVQ